MRFSRTLVLMLDSSAALALARCLDTWMLDPGHEPRPTTAATMIGVRAKRISRSKVSLPGVSCNRNRSTPRARSRFRDDNYGANERPLPTRDQKYFSQ